MPEREVEPPFISRTEWHGGDLFSSRVDEWSTPDSFMAVLRQEFTFDLDPCALECSAKAPRYFTPADDGLVRRWHGTVFMNPPYGDAIGRWIAKARDEALAGATVVALVPARTDTAYWHDYVMTDATEVRLVRGRLHFGGGHQRNGHNAAFPSAVVIFRPEGGPPTLAAMEREVRAMVPEQLGMDVDCA